MNTEIKILHTASAGVVIRILTKDSVKKDETEQADFVWQGTGKRTLGIDMFSHDQDGLYPDTPEGLKIELLRKIEEREIETLFFTHGHGDHFCLEDVLEALQRNPELCIISTSEVIGRIRASEKNAGTMYAIPPDKTDNIKINLPGITMEVFHTKHMGEQYADVQNLACMLRIGEKKLLVPGDAWPTPDFFARVRSWSPKIDCLMAPFPLIGLPSTRRIIAKNLEIEHILALHLPRPEADTQNWTASAKAVCDRARDSLPMPEFAECLGEEYTL